MGQPLDMKRIRENDKRKLVMRDYAQIPRSFRDTFLTILQVEGTRSEYFRTCITCEHFESLEALDPSLPPVERCKKFNVLPPAKIIADGCESYNDFDEIPF